MKNKYIRLAVVLLIIINGAYAAKKISSDTETARPQKAYPTGCKTLGYEFSNGVLVLKPEHKRPDQAQVIYFIQNISKQDILFSDQRDSSDPYIIYNNNVVKPGQWAVYAADKKTKFICSNNDKVQSIKSIVDCENTVKLCEYANVKFAPNNRGNYWATSNLPMMDAVREIIHQGILLKS